MNALLNRFFDRLAERLAALIAGLISSRFLNLQATDLATQQNELEEHARRYEQEGKPEIAETLRERIRCLGSANLAARGDEILGAVTEELPRISAVSLPPAAAHFPDPSLLAPGKALRAVKPADCTGKRSTSGGNA